MARRCRGGVNPPLRAPRPPPRSSSVPPFDSGRCHAARNAAFAASRLRPPAALGRRDGGACRGPSTVQHERSRDRAALAASVRPAKLGRTGTPLFEGLSHSPNTNSMVWSRISRSSGVSVIRPLDTRLKPVRTVTYCLPPASNVTGGALMPTPTLIETRRVAAPRLWINPRTLSRNIVISFRGF